MKPAVLGRTLSPGALWEATVVPGAGLGLGFGDRWLNWQSPLHIPSHWTPPAWWGTRVISICPTAQMKKLRPTVTQHSSL